MLCSKRIEFDEQAVGLAHEGCTSRCRFSGTLRRSSSSSLIVLGLRVGSRYPKSIFHVEESRRTVVTIFNRWRIGVARLIRRDTVESRSAQLLLIPSYNASSGRNQNYYLWLLWSLTSLKMTKSQKFLNTETFQHSHLLVRPSLLWLVDAMTSSINNALGQRRFAGRPHFII